MGSVSLLKTISKAFKDSAMSQVSGEGAAFVGAGATAGAWVSVTVGGMGLAFSGTAVSLGFTPITAVGAVTGAAGYGAFKAIIEGDASALGAAALGGLGGASLSMTIGGMGLAFKGTAISLGLAPITVAGSVVGLAVYGFLKILNGSGGQESPGQTFERMAYKIAWQEAYHQALLELNLEALERSLLGDPVERQFTTWELDAELEALKTQMEIAKFPVDAIQQKLRSLTTSAFPKDVQLLPFTEFKQVKVEALQETITRNGESLERSASQLLESVKDKTQGSTGKGSLILESQLSSEWVWVRTLKGHTADVNAVAFYPDSRLLASGSDDRTVHLWNLQTGKQLFTFLGQANEVSSVAISPDARTLVSASFDCKVTAWHLESRKFLQTYFYRTACQSYPYSHKGFVYAVAISPDSQWIASGGEDQTIRLWNLQSGKIIKSFKGHLDNVLALAFSSNGKVLASSSADKTVKVWDLSSGELIYSLDAHTGWVFSIAISQDGQFLASGSADGTLKLWSLESGRLFSTLAEPSGAIFSIAISPDGQILAGASGKTGKVRLWNLQTGKLLQILPGQSPVSFSPDGCTLVTGGYEGSIKIWQQTLVRNQLAVDAVLHGEWWEVLGVSNTANQEEVKQAYRLLAKFYHPDTNSSANATINMQLLIRAYKEYRQHAKL
jgi:WD40 repeat protein